MWEYRLKNIEYAFQPIISMKTGDLYGYEALLRNYQFAGYETIFTLFDEAYHDNSLYTLDLWLRKKVLKKFKKIKNHENLKIFYNLDNRLLEMPNFGYGNTRQLLDKYDINDKSICFEISEKHELHNYEGIAKILLTYKKEGYAIAIDDFGSGFSNLQNLFCIDVDILKIDRFFISNIEKSKKKQIFVKHIVDLVHSIGGIIVAEGIETKEEYKVCKSLGCDLAQGYFIDKPMIDLEMLKTDYKNIIGGSNEKIKKNLKEIFY